MFKTIRAKLLSSFLLMLLLIGGLGITAYQFSQTNNALVAEAIDKDFNGSVAIARLAVEAQKIRRFEKEYFIYVGDGEKAKKYQKDWTNTYDAIKTQLADLVVDLSGVWSEAEKTEFKQWQIALFAYGEGFRKVITDANSGVIKDTLAANAAIAEAKEKFRGLLDGTAKVGEQKLANAKVAQTKIIRSHNTLAFVLAGAVGGSVLLCLGLVMVVPASITKPIKTLSDAATAISTGNLHDAVPTVQLNDFVGLAETLERMRVSLKLMMECFSPSENGSVPLRADAPDKRRARGTQVG